jgi:hypothetical protein
VLSKAKDWLEMKMVSMVSITHIHAGGYAKGPAELRNFGTPELRLEGFSPGTPVSLLFGFSSGLEKTVSMSGARVTCLI